MASADENDDPQTNVESHGHGFEDDLSDIEHGDISEDDEEELFDTSDSARRQQREKVRISSFGDLSTDEFSRISLTVEL